MGGRGERERDHGKNKQKTLTSFLPSPPSSGTYKSTYDDALAETDVILTETVADLLSKTGIDPLAIDVVITSCSCFAPTPSMAAHLTNKFGFRMDVLTYSLAGMGCASSLICVDMAKHLLKVGLKTRVKS